MLIKNKFEVAQPLDKVWEFFEDMPQVAACLPGAELTEDLGDDDYGGTRRRPDGSGQAARSPARRTIVERDDATKRMVIDAAGADQKGRGQASHDGHRPARPGRQRHQGRLDQDLQLSGAAAQYGRGMIADVTAVLMGQFATNMQQRIERPGARRVRRRRRARRPRAASAIGLRAAQLALMRVFRRFFLPYQPDPRLRRRLMVLWWIGNIVLLLVVVPVLVALLNRVLAALERIRGASDDILAGGGRARRRAGRRTRGPGHDRRDRRAPSPPVPSATPARSAKLLG